MPEFREVAQRAIPFGENSYIEVTRKRLVEPGKPDSEFLVVSRGFFEKDGATKHWTKFVTLPDLPEVKAWLAQALTEI